MLASLATLLAPSRCLACRRRGRMPWCDVCGRDAPALVSGCATCAAPTTGGVAAACPLAASAVTATVAAHAYRGVVAAAIRAAKLEGCWAGWRPMGLALGALVATFDWPAIDVVTGVPGDPRRRRRRGFDHAAMLAEAVAEAAGLPTARLLSIGHSLDRVGAGGRQAPATSPRHAASRAGEVAPVASPCRGHVLLVDDIVTTGHTVAQAAAALRAAGAGRVSVAAVARAGDH